MQNIISRKQFLKNTAYPTAGVLLGTSFPVFSNLRKEINAPYSVIDEVKKYRKFDAHGHVTFDIAMEKRLLHFGDTMGVDKMCISFPITDDTKPNNFNEVKRHNDVVIKALKRHPDRFIGFMTLDPRFKKESMNEISRCVDQGLIGYKGFTQVKINHPLYYPIIERFIDLKILIFMHAFCQLGVGGYRMKYDIEKYPNTSIPEDFVDISKRYPDAVFQFAHLGGGGDWEYITKTLKNTPNVYVDVSGSNNEENIIDFAVKNLGEDRLFFGTDNSFFQAIGRILSSNLSEIQKRKVFFENYSSVLKRLDKNVD